MSRFVSLGEQVIDICWNRTVQTSPSKDSISMYQVFDLIREMQLFLSVKTLLNTDEMKLLTQMAERSSSSKLHKQEAYNFLNKLVQTSSWEDFLQERAGISHRALQTMIQDNSKFDLFESTQKTKPFKKPLSPYSIHKRNSISRNDLTGNIGFNREKEERSRSNDTFDKPTTTSIPPFSRNRPSPSLSPPRFGLTSRLRPKIYDDTETTSSNDNNKNNSTFSINTNNRELNELRRLVRSKEQHIQEIERQYSIVSNENIDLSSETKRQRAKITDLENSKTNLNKYIEALEAQLESKRFGPIGDKSSQSERTLIKELINKNSQQDITIRELGTICDRYQQDLTSLAKHDEINQKLINELKKSLTRQDDLISDLQIKLDLQTNVSTSIKNGLNYNTLQDFIKNLPFVKQYYMYYKYQQDHKNPGIIFINSATLLFTAIILLNIIKFIFYVSITLGTIGTGRDHNLLDYDWEDDGTSPWLSTYVDTEGIGLAGWKQIPWLEYWVYRINDWLYE